MRPRRFRIGASVQRDEYSKNLFPEFQRYMHEHEKQDYVQGVLVDLANVGELRVNHLLRHPYPVIDAIAAVLMGHQYVAGKQIGGQYVPPQLSQYRVGLKSVGGKRAIRYKHGHRPTEVISRAVGLSRQNILVQDDHFVYPCGVDATEGTVDLPTAWRVLAQHGPENTSASSPKIKQKQHHYDEVVVEQPNAKQVETTSRRGRPRHTDMRA